jgi:hypothetical protein
MRREEMRRKKGRSWALNLKDGRDVRGERMHNEVLRFYVSGLAGGLAGVVSFNSTCT